LALEQQLFTIKEVCDPAGFPAHRVRDDPGRADSTGLHWQGLAPDTRESLESLKQPVESPECFPQAVLGCGIQVGPEED
jgi:hypothetical protein